MLKKLSALTLVSFNTTSVWCMEDQAFQFNIISENKRKREVEESKEPIFQAPAAPCALPDSEPEKKRFKEDPGDNQDYCVSLESLPEELRNKAEAGDKEAIIEAYKRLDALDDQCQHKEWKKGEPWEERQAKERVNQKERDLLETWMLKAAEQGHALAQRHMGKRCWGHHRYTRISAKEAMEWFTKAAEQGDVVAQNDLGFMYETGIDCEKDYQKALEWYEKATAQGSPLTEFMRGRMYEKGKGTEINLQKAAECYAIAAAAGDIKSQKKLGKMYEKGRGVARDIHKAIEWYTKAADQGHGRAMYSLGKIYYYPAEGVIRDLKKAAQLFFKADLTHKIESAAISILLDYPANYDESGQKEFSSDAENDMRHLKINLSHLYDTYVAKEAFMGGRFSDTYNNPLLQDLATKVSQACKAYQRILVLLRKKPGFLINCLEINPDIKGNHNLFDLHYTVGNERYWSFHPENLDLLQKNILAEPLEQERQENVNVLRALEIVLRENFSLNELNLFVKGMKVGGNYDDANPSFLSAYLSPYFTLENDLEIRKNFLIKLNEIVKAHQEEVENSLEFATQMFATLLKLIKETVGARNGTFSHKTGFFK